LTDTMPALPQTGALCAHGRRLRVMHVVNCLQPGGAEFGILKLINGLGEDQFEHRLCVTRSYEADFVAAHGLGERLSTAAGSRRGLQFPLFRLMRIFRQHRPDIVHTRNWGGLEAVPAARLAGVPVVIHSEHGYEVGNLSGLPVRQRVFRRFAYSLADRVFTVTRELREYHARQAWLSPEHIGVIYNGVDTSRYAPSACARERVRDELGIPAGRLILGSVGRLVPIKDYGTLLKAAEVLLQRNADVHVVIAGKGPESDSLQRQANASALLRPRVTFAGASDRVPDLLAAMDIFVLPSLGEGMSNTLLEALAAGLPVLATRVGGNSEVVGDEFSDWMFAPRDVQGLVQRIERMAADEGTRRRLGACGRLRAVEEFGLGGMLRRYSELYSAEAAKRGILPGGEESAVAVPARRMA